jgi:hypothetical protein
MSSSAKGSKEEAILIRRCLIGRRTDHDECQGAMAVGGDGKSARREGKMKLREASEVLYLGYRQTRRVYRWYLREGDKGLTG